MLWRPRKAAPAEFIEPCLPSPASRPPRGNNWIHEIKHDGYRMMARRDAAGIRLLTKNGHDWAARYPLIVAAVNALRCKSCLIDGETIVTEASGLASFAMLRSRKKDATAVLCAFDLIEIDGEDLRKVPLEERRSRLYRLTRRPHPGLAINEQYQTEGAIVFHNATELGCEGIVSKRKGSLYRSGKSFDWIKSKNPQSPAVRREQDEDWAK